MMKLSPLQPQGSYFTQVNLRAVPNAKPEDKNRFDLVVETDITRPEPDRPRYWFVCLTVKISPQKDAVIPYSGEVEMVGGFDIDATWPEESMEKLVYVNGSGVLYAAIREMICAITARGFYDMFVLPSWSFAEMFKEQAEIRKKQAERTEGIPAVKVPVAPGVEASHSAV